MNARLFISFVDELLQSSLQEASQVGLLVLLLAVSTVSGLLFIIVSIAILLDLLSRHLRILLVYIFLPRVNNQDNIEQRAVSPAEIWHRARSGCFSDCTSLHWKSRGRNLVWCHRESCTGHRLF